MSNVYLKSCEKSLYRLLSMYDWDPYSETKGIGDREYWGWKSRDYVNATMQGGVLTLAALLKLGHFKNYEDKILTMIKGIIKSVERIQYNNSSVDEIMPYENSFCVAAALTVDILFAIELLDGFITEFEKKEYLKICKSLIKFYANNIETHGIISNHLAAGVAGIFKYENITGDMDYHCKGIEILNKIIRHQSVEGWYMEYEGADPGYQTLCTYYMGIVYKETKDKKILESINHSLEFLSYCIHPDGTIGGEYGSRNTQLYYPAGFEILRSENETAARIADFMMASISNNDTITIDVIDNGNFIPYINNYIVAYMEYTKNKKVVIYKKLPWEERQFLKSFNDSGLIFINKSSYYAVLNIKKGGILKVFDKGKRSLIFDDCGFMGELNNGSKITTQIYNNHVQYKINNNEIQVLKHFYGAPSELPTPLKFIILRLMNVTIMRMSWINRIIKILLVRLLITNKKKINLILDRELVFNEKDIIIQNNIKNNTKYILKWLEYGRKFTSIHMASSKYFNKHYLIKNELSKDIDIKELNSKKRIEIHRKIEF